MNPEKTSQEPLDRVRLRAIMRDADLRVLLMCLFHITGESAWLEPPYRPSRDVRLVADPAAGLPDDVQEHIREAAVELLANGFGEPSIVDPGDELMQRMMDVTLGEEVPFEYARMMREDMGLTAGHHDWPSRPSPDDLSSTTVLIVGAGVSGLALGAQLTRLGLPYTIVEKNTRVGGTWWENRYPGAGVDTPNHAYSFSFGRPNRWTRFFALRDEIYEYIESRVDEFGIRGNIRFSTEVVRAVWDESGSCWHVTLRTSDGREETVQVAVLVSAVGLLNAPSVPPIEGLDSFAGPSFHSARWPDDLDLRGRRVAVVGTGASAMQLVPSIAADVESVTIYQRSAQWARPIGGYRDDMPAGAQWLLEHMPFYAPWFRFTMAWRYGDGLLKTLRKDPEWPHPERAVNRRNDLHREELTEFIQSELADHPDLLARAVPDYPPFGKRILIDNGWFQTLTRPNVDLVTEAIDHIDASGVVTTDGCHHEADIIVFATGFQVTQLTARLNVTGRADRSLADAWANDNPTAHLGITVPGFPNLFCMAGPNAGLAHGGSAIFQAESQARYISSCLIQMVTKGIAALDVRPEVHDAYVRRVDAEHDRLIWTHPGMTNWYRNRSGRVVAIMPWRLVDYWAMTHDADLSDFRVAYRTNQPAADRLAVS